MKEHLYADVFVHNGESKIKVPLDEILTTLQELNAGGIGYGYCVFYHGTTDWIPF